MAARARSEARAAGPGPAGRHSGREHMVPFWGVILECHFEGHFGMPFWNAILGGHFGGSFGRSF